MSIARVPGYSLLSDLDRQGIDLEFSTNGQTLTYMDFANFRLGINTSSPSQSLEVVGNVLVTNGHVYSSANVSYDIGSTSNWFRTIYANSINSTNLTGTIQTVNQPNITGLGNLANLTVLGNIVAGNISTVGTIAITGNLSVDNLTANTYTGNIITGNQPFITNLANITLTNLISTANVSANWLTANSANVSNIYGTIRTANQPYISNLGNISVDSITIGGNISITGNTNGGIINADELYENDYRVLTSNSNIVISGDIVGYGTYNNVVVSFANVGVTAGSYGNSQVVPSIVVDSKGRITSAANVVLTRVGNITVNDNTVSTTGNLILSPSTGIVDLSNNRISNIAEPINSSDAVTKSYLESALVFSANVLAAGDSTVTLTDGGVANLSTVLDGNLTSVQTPTATTFYQAVTAGELTLDGNTISSTGNIVLDAAGAGIVQILGTDAVGIPSGGVGTRPGSPMIGYTRFNTDTAVIETWDGNTWTSPGMSTVTSETIVPDGTSNSFTLSSNVSSAYGLLVSINGTLQQPITSYDVNANQLIFTEIPQVTDVVEIRTFAAGITVSALQYGSTEVSLSTGNVDITGNLMPTANVTYDIGSETLRWRDIYLAGNTINLGGSTISVVNNELTFTPSGSSTISLSTDIDPSIIYAGNTNVKVTSDYVNVTVAGTNVASFASSNLRVVGNILADGFNYSNGVSILDGVISLITGNAAMQAGLIDELTSNAAVQAGLIAAAGEITANANVAMKGYVDGQISGVLDGTSFTGTVAIPTLTLTNSLAINYGGTGGTSSSEALNNLFPSGEVSGYVLKTAGEGSYYWSAETGGGSTVGTTISTSRVYKTATSGQTVFTGLGTYTPGAGQLRIYLNGVRQFDSAYTETNSSAVTLSTGVSSGTVLLAEIDGYTDFNAYANATYSSPVGTISSTTVQDALAELDSEKAALAGAAFTGNVSTTGNLRVTNTTQSTGEGTGALVVSGGASFGGNVYISGNLQVAGTETIFNANNLNIADSLIYLADDNTGDVLDIGIISSFTNPGYQHTGFVRDATDGVWKLFANVVAEPTTTVDFTNATYSNLRIGNLTSVGGTFTGNLSAGNLSATNLTGTLTTAAQTNITSVGTLTGLTVSGAPVPNANVSVNLGSTSAWWSILYANTHVGATATFSNVTGTLLTASQPNITGVGTITSGTWSADTIAVNKGGTGATTTSGVGGALDNLLPSGEQTGYVLSTSGAGTYSWVAPTAGGTTVGQSLVTLRQANTATAGQTIFTLVSGTTYTPGAGQLRVYINGVRQFPSEYTETSATVYTLTSGVSAGDIVFAEIDRASSFNNYANLTYASNVGNIAASGLTVQSAIESLENNKAPLASPVFTGTATAGNVTINGLTTLAETTETLDTKSSVTGTVVHDFSTTAIWYYSSISGNVTANITNVPTTNNRITSISMVVNQGVTGYIVNGLQIDGAAQTIRWQANTVPTASTNRVDVFTFSLLRAANAWTVLGSATSHG